MNEAGLFLKIDGFKDFNEAIRQLDKVIEDIDSRLDAAATALNKFVEKAKTTTSFSKFVDGLGILFKELNLFQTNSAGIVQSVNSLTRAFSIMFDVFSSKRGSLESLTRQIANFSANRGSLNQINKTINELGTVRGSGLTQLSNLGGILSGIGKAIDPLNKFRPLFGLKFKILANQLASAVPGLEKFIGAFGKTAEATEQSRLVFRNLLDLTNAIGNISKINFSEGKFLGIFGSGKLEKNLRGLSRILAETADGFASFAKKLSGDRLSFNSFERLIQSLGVLQNIRIGSGGILSIFGGVGPKIQQLSKFLGQSAEGFAKFGTALPSIAKDLGIMIQRFEALAASSRTVATAFRQLGIIESTGQRIRRLATDITTGFRQGFGSLVTQARERASAFINAFARVLGIRSPSTVFAGFGRDIVGGLVQGIGSLVSTALRLGGDFARSFLRGLSHLRTEIANFSRNLAQTAQSSIQRGLQTITAGGIVSFAQARAIQFPIQSAVEFEDAFAGVIKTVDVEDLGDEAGQRFLTGLREGLRELATGDTPVAGLANAQIELANIAEAAGQLGIARDDILEFTETMGQLSLATNIVGEEGSAQLAQFANIVQTTEFSRLGATITALGNAGASTESQILEFAQRMAGAGDAAGLTEDEILAIGNAMASLGLNAEAGSSAFNQFLTELTRATAVEQRTVTGAQRIAAAEREVSQLQADRTLVLRNLESAQDRLNRATTTSSRNAALTSLERAQAQLTELDSTIQSAQGSVSGISETAVFNLTAGSKELEAFAKVAGLTAAEFADSFKNEPVVAIQRFVEGLSALNNQEQVQVLDELGLDGLRLSDTLRRLAGNTGLLEDSLAVAAEAWVENNALTEEAEKRFQTMRSQIERAKNIIRDLAITIGDALVPDFSRLLELVSGTVTRFNEFAKANPELTRRLARAAVVIGSVAAGLITLSGVFSLLGGGLLTVAASGVGLVTGAFTALTAIFFNPIGVIAGLLAVGGTIIGILPLLAVLGIAGVAAFRIIERLVSDVRNNVGGAGDSFNNLRDAVLGLFSAIAGILGPALTFFNGILNTVLDGLLGVRGQLDTLNDTVGQSGLAAFFDFIANRVTAFTTQLQRAADILRGINVFAGFGGQDTGTGVVRNGTEISQRSVSLENTRNKLTVRRLVLLEKIASAERNIAAGVGDQTDNRAILESLRTELVQVEAELPLVEVEFQAQLEKDEFNASLSETEQTINRLAQNPIVIDLFGPISNADKDTLRTLVGDIETSLGNIRTFAGLVPTALRQIFSGDILGGLSSLQTIVSGIGRNISDMFSAVGDALNGPQQPLVALTGENNIGSAGELGLGEKLVQRLRDEITKITGIELQGSLEALFNRVIGVAKIAVGVVFGPVAGAVLSIGSLLSDLINVEITDTGIQIENGVAQTNLETVLREHLLPILGAAATLVLGPVAGAVIGIASLVVTAIENDFLGLGTLIEQSGIKAALEGAFNVLQGLFSRIFGGGGSDTAALSAEGTVNVSASSGGLADNPFIQTILGIIDNIKIALDQVGTFLGPSFNLAISGLQNGVKGFVDAIGGIETGNIESILNEVGGGINVFIGLVGVGVSATLSVVGALLENVLPALGGVIAGFVNAMGSLLTADIEGVLSGIGRGIGSLVTGAAGLVGDLADRVIGVLEGIFGAELPSVDEGLGAAISGIGGLIQALPDILNRVLGAAVQGFDNLRFGMQREFLKLLLSILDEVNRLALEFSNGLKTSIVDPLNNIAIGLGFAPIVFDAAALQIDTTAVENRITELDTMLAENQPPVDVLNQAGQDLGQGLVDGIVARIPDADVAARDLVLNGIQNPILDELEAHSPSQWAIRAAADLILGFVIGLGVNSVLLAIAVGLVELQFQRLRLTVLTQSQGMARDFDVAANRIVSAANRIAGAINAARNAVATAQAEGLSTPGFAAGGVAQGLAWVGERGRELIFAGGEMSVLNNRTSEAMAMGYRMGLSAAGGFQGFLQRSGLFGGWRQFGGEVMRNQFYGFSENGRPEVFQSNNGQRYLLSSTGGAVSPIREASTAPIASASGSTSYTLQIRLPETRRVHPSEVDTIREGVRQAIGAPRGSFTRRGNRSGAL